MQTPTSDHGSSPRVTLEGTYRLRPAFPRSPPPLHGIIPFQC